MEKSYTIQVVSKITGTNPHTLRAWERRYNAVDPSRDKNGRRVYSEKDLERLVLLSQLSSNGYQISTIANYSLENLKNIKEEFNINESTLRHSKSTHLDFNSILQNLIMAIKSYKLDIITHELEKIQHGCSLREFSLNLVVPLLQEVGDMCETKQINVAQEHALSALLKFYVGSHLYDYAISNTDSLKSVVIAAPEGELHEFGIMVAALLAKYYKIKFQYLGPNLPAESLIDCAQQIRPTHIILGFSKNMVKNKVFADEYINTIAAATPECEIIIGGHSVNRDICVANNLKIVPSLKMLDYELAKIGSIV